MPSTLSTLALDMGGPFSTKFLDKVRQAATKFICPFKPAASWGMITTPRQQGGLGVINPTTK
jgi:hypothetical protein